MKNILFLGHFPGPKISPHGKTVYYKAENYKFIVDKPGRQHFDQVIKFSIIKSVTNICVSRFDGIHHLCNKSFQKCLTEI